MFGSSWGVCTRAETVWNACMLENTMTSTPVAKQLTLRLADAGRMDDIVKAARDKEYREQLLKEFELDK